MFRISKKLVSAVLAVSLVTAISVTASADIIDFDDPTISHTWDIRSIGGGAPSSADRSERFYLLYSRWGAEGDCKTLTSDDTTFGIRLSCIDEFHTIDYYPMEEDMFGKYIVWNGKGVKKWTYFEENGKDVRYQIGSYGLKTYSTGTVSRV